VSYTRETTIWCDGADPDYPDDMSCCTWEQATGTAKDARERAKSKGWTRTKDGKDLCPRCSKAAQEKP
jgi:hypothetical protein